jgi:hypothetical protein
MLDQRCGRQVPQDLGAGGDALCVKSALRNPVGHVRNFLSISMSKAATAGLGLPPHTYAHLRHL